MKKLVIIIIVLLMIFVGMLIYKNAKINSKDQVSAQEVEKIETYITKIYMWKEVTNEALPTFKNINEVNDMWVWEAVKKNLENYELTYDEIQNKSKELFGQDFTKEFPKEGTENFMFDEQTGKYYATGMGLDQEEDCFLINNIKKTENGYEVEIVEYLEDYSQETISEEEILENSNSTENELNGDMVIIIRNLNNEEIGRINANQESPLINEKTSNEIKKSGQGNQASQANQENQQVTSQDIVKNNIDKFNKKIVTLKQEGDNLYVQKVSNKM